MAHRRRPTYRVGGRHVDERRRLITDRSDVGAPPRRRRQLADSAGSERRRLDGLPEGRGSTSPTKRWTATPPAPGPTSHSASSGGVTAARRDLRTSWPRRPTGSPTSSLGSGPGPASASSSYAGRVPELYVAALGRSSTAAWSRPLFSAFGPEPIRERHGARATARVLVTTPALYRRKVAPHPRPASRARARAPRRRRPGDRGAVAPRTRCWPSADRATRSRRPTPRTRRCCTSPAARPASRRARCTSTRRSSPTTPPAARARPAPRRHLLVHRRPGLGDRHVVRHHRPAHHGVTSIVDEGEFDAERWYRILAETAGHRLVHRADRDPHADAGGAELPHEHDLSRAAVRRQRRRAAEPRGGRLGREAFGLPFHDNWWQTETGGIMIANHRRHARSGPARWAARCPASRRRSCVRDDDGRRAVPDGASAGRRSPARGRAGPAAGLALDVPRLLDDDERYRKCFAGGWYLTGDLARRDADGYSGSSAGPTT